MARSDPATERQLEYAQTLLRDREVPDGLRRGLAENPKAALTSANYDRGTISSLIELLSTYPRTAAATAPSPDGELKPGVYALNDQVYVVKPNRQGTRLYAKRLVDAPGERLHDDDSVSRLELEYAPGIIAVLLPRHRMPAADVAELSARYGRCVMCGSPLKAAKSVERAIGPVCWRKVQ